MGACLLNLGKPEEALAEYNVALEQDPDNLNAMHNRGVAQKQMGDTTEAMETFMGVVERDPAFKQSYRGVIEAAMSLEDYDTALEWVEKAYEQDEEDFSLVTDKANILLKLGRAEESLPWYESVIEHGKATEQVNQLYSIGLSQTAVTKDQEGDLETAEIFYDKAIEIEGTETRLFNRSYLYMRTERVPAAIEGFGQVCELNPENIKAQAVLGTLLLQEERFDECVGPLRVASAGSEGDDFTDVTYNLGFALLKVEQFEEAASTFESVLAVDAENKNAQNGLRAAQHAHARAERKAAKEEEQAAAVAAAEAAGVEAPEPEEDDEEDEEEDVVADLPMPTSAGLKLHEQVSMDIGTAVLQNRGYVRKQVKRLSTFPGQKTSGGSAMGSAAFKKKLSEASAVAAVAEAAAPAPAAAAAARGPSASFAEEEFSVDEYFTADQLRSKPLPGGVDPARREQWLPLDEFQTLFGMTKDSFNALPKWKRINLKKKNDLF